MEAQAKRFGTEFIEGNVTRVDLAKPPFQVWIDDERVEVAEALIIATGASAKLLGIPSEGAFMGFGVSACATCDGFFFKEQEHPRRRRRRHRDGGGDLPHEASRARSRSSTGATSSARRRSCSSARTANPEDRVDHERRADRGARRWRRSRQEGRRRDAARHRDGRVAARPRDRRVPRDRAPAELEAVPGPARHGRDRLHP